MAIAQLLRFPVALVVFSFFYFGFWGVIQVMILLLLMVTIIFPRSIIQLAKSDVKLSDWTNDFEKGLLEPFRVSALIGVFLGLSHLAGISSFGSSRNNPQMCISLETGPIEKDIIGTTASGVLLHGTARRNDFTFVPFENLNKITYPPCD